MLTQLILATVIENVDHAIIIADKEGNFILWNNSAREILGMSEDIMKRNVWADHFKIFKLNGEPYANHELPIMKGIQGQIIKKEKLLLTSTNPDEGRYLEVDAFPIMDTEGSIVGAVASFTDITDRKKIVDFCDSLVDSFNHMRSLLEKSMSIKKLNT